MPASQPDQSATDKRWKTINLVMQRHDHRPEALIETLHAAQEAFGFLDPETLAYIATQLDVPPAKVYGVTTFYNHFNCSPRGEHFLEICTGTACHVKGTDRIAAWAQEKYGLEPGQTTADNRLSMVEVRCVGACALAPVIITDGTLIGAKTIAETTDLIEEWLHDDAP
ncbi:NAD(P)H-dependent oxidoreductase subunit E [Desulfobulbus alkaliphilus]|uniref:NAD(P)H-dependent oxidoreductase subunit E n=1 Tax=Desulfobulbus alkaliphilus TaxID=869814 RepID=UPI001963DB4C|nr:NAD(P)H-dependent oxidoreductase subunit E [Desulfobulbus alkaliphilus]MBM9535563.1 NAD(P)H-dependent oxidoreductase subunit E [Desulfobulbus alkaliphilus]